MTYRPFYRRQILVALAAFFLAPRRCLSYNLEDRLPLFKYGPKNAKFGFSVALHRATSDISVDERGTMLMAGAPTASYRKWSSAGQPSKVPENPGGVFYCPVSTDPRSCTRIRMDEGGDSVFNNVTNVTSIRSNQWLGATVKSQGPGKYLIACAHRYTERSNVGQEEYEVERLCGKCFLLKAEGMDTIKEIPAHSPESPLHFYSSLCDLWREYPRQLSSKRYYGHSQSGSSVTFEGDRYVLGAPGTWSWTGTVLDMRLPGGDRVYKQLYITPACRDRKNCPNAPVSRDSYTGLAVATSTNVESGSDELFYAAGAPRGNFTGAVVFFRKGPDDAGRIKLIPDDAKTVFGEKIGSSFGYSITLTDVNGDELDDLIVGAPQYFKSQNGRKSGGAVYIYLNNPNSHFGLVNPMRVYGHKDSFFGHSVAALGDIDQDGYNDFAVGAPYEGKNGAVHIFRGSKNGPKESQVIKGSDYSFVKSEFREIVGFGYSLSGSVDADSNEYPDLLVGTLSDSIALLRSRPVITINASMDVTVTELNLEEKSCLQGRRHFTCFELSFCFSYSARHGDYPANVATKYNLTLDKIRRDHKKSSRIHFDTPDGEEGVFGTVTLPRPGMKICPGESRKIFFSNGAEDKLTPIVMTFEFDLDFPDVTRENKSDPIFDLIQDPILDADSRNKFSFTLPIKNECGDDGCQSDLRVSAEMQKEMLAGGDTNITINVTNEGEEAHRAFVNVFLPPDVTFEEANLASSTKGMSCFLTSSYTGKSSVVRCSLGNPYKRGMQRNIVIRLSTSRLDPEIKSIAVRIEGQTKSKNPDIPPIVLRCLVVTEWSMSLTATAQPLQVIYKNKPIVGESEMKNTDDVGPFIEYTFNVENSGQFPVVGAVVEVDLPMEIANGKWLLYLVSSDVEAGGDFPVGTCNDTYVNNLLLEPAVSAAASASSRGRNKRSAETLPDKVAFPEAQASTDARGEYVSVVNLACENNNARCVAIKCDLDVVEPLTSTSVVMQIHVWVETFLEEFKNVDFVHIKTGARLSARDPAIRFRDGIPTVEEVQTTVYHETFASDVTPQFPWWYLLIGGLFLLLIYIVAIVLLAKCGFFSRKKYRRVQAEDETASQDREIKEDEL